MSMINTDSVNYNSAYLSLNLLDELDYCLGGYGKPGPEFIFTLNTFVESFIGCSEFYTSLDELNHLNLTAAALFPDGRPILNLVVRNAGLKFVSGVLNNPGKIIYHTDFSGKTKKEAEQDFISSQGITLKDKYFIQSHVDQVIAQIPHLTAKFEDRQFLVSEALNTPYDLVSNLIKVSNTSSIQTTIPIYLYSQQISELAKVPYSIEALEKLSKIHQVKVEELRQSIGYRLLPIPPFTNILLGQVKSIMDIPAKLTQLRADFQELRQKFIDLEKNIYESSSLKEQYEAQKGFNDFWLTFNKKYINKSHRIFYGHLDIFKDAELDKAFNETIEDKDWKDVINTGNYGKIIGKTISRVYDWNQDRKVVNRFKGLTHIWELMENTSNVTQLLQQFERVFEMKFDEAELVRVQRYIKQIQPIPGLISHSTGN